MKRSPLQRKTRLQSHSTLQRTPIKKRRGKLAKAREFTPDIKEAITARSFGRCEYCRKFPIHSIHHAGKFRSHLSLKDGNGGLENAIGLCVFCDSLVHQGTEGQMYRVMFAELAKRLACIDIDNNFDAAMSSSEFIG